MKNQLWKGLALAVALGAVGCSAQVGGGGDFDNQAAALSEPLLDFDIDLPNTEPSEKEQTSSLPSAVIVKVVPHTVTFNAADGVLLAQPGGRFASQLNIDTGGKSVCATVLALGRYDNEPTSLQFGIAQSGEVDPVPASPPAATLST